MPAYADLVHQTSTTTGAGNLTLVAVNGKRTFLAAFGTGGTNTFDYYISHREAAEWERGTGHEAAGALVRDTVLASSNANAAVAFSSGIKDVTNDQPADKRADKSYAPIANVLINGDFRVNQFGHVSAAALAAGTYGHDQWKAGAAGGDYSFSQLKGSTQITIAAGKSIIQPIEDVNVEGGSYVLSWVGTAQARAGINTLTPSGAFAASPLLITGQTAGTVMSVEFNAGTLGTVKLEKGSTASLFVMRPYDQELATCQRYYEKGINALAQTNATGGNIGSDISYRVVKRVAPTLAITNVAGASVGFPSIGSANVYGCQIVVAVLAAGAVWYVFDYAADARL